MYKLRCDAPTQKPTNTRTVLQLEAPLVVEHAVSCSVLAALFWRAKESNASDSENWESRYVHHLVVESAILVLAE